MPWCMTISIPSRANTHARHGENHEHQNDPDDFDDTEDPDDSDDPDNSDNSEHQPRVLAGLGLCHHLGCDHCGIPGRCRPLVSPHGHLVQARIRWPPRIIKQHITNWHIAQERKARHLMQPNALPQPPERHRASPLTGQDVRLLRQQAGLSIAQLAALLDCHPYTLRTLESNPARRIGRPLARALLLVVAPDGVAHVEAALAHARTVLEPRVVTD